MIKKKEINMNTNISKNEIPQETLTIVCGILKPYADVSESSINSLVTGKPKSKTDETFLSTKELMKLLGFSYMTLSRARKAGDLSYIKTNPNRSGRVLYKLSEVNRWLDTKKVG